MFMKLQILKYVYLEGPLSTNFYHVVLLRKIIEKKNSGENVINLKWLKMILNVFIYNF